MKVTINMYDEAVIVEGEPYNVDMADMPDYMHVVHWNGTYGEVEFKPDKNGRKLPNLRFSDFTPLEFMVDRWRKKKRTADDRKAREEVERTEKEQERRAVEEKARQQRPM